MYYINKITKINDLKYNDDGKTLFVSLDVILEESTSHEIVNGYMVLPRFLPSRDNIPSFLSNPEDKPYEIVINEL